MPVYEYKGQFFDLTETDPVAAKAKIQSHLGEVTKTTPETPGFLDRFKGTPSWMVSKPGQGWDDANAPAAGGDVTNPMAYLTEAQKTEQSPAMQTVGQGVNRAVQIGAGVAKGAVINPVAAVAQVAGGETGRQFAQETQKSYEQQRKAAGAEGFDFAQLAGAVVSPVNRFLPGGGYTGGAVGALTQPLEGGEYNTFFDVVEGKIKQATAGAVLGKVAENLIGALTPKLKEGARELMDRGVSVSPGQAYEGVPGWLFRHMETLGLGPSVDKVNKQFNNVVANDVLSSIEQEVSKNVPPGQASVRLVQRRISNFYDDTLKNLGVNKLDREYKDGVNKAITDAVADISDPVKREFITKRLVGSLNANIRSRVTPEGISGENIKLTQEWLKREIERVDGKADVVSTSLKSGYSDILANLNQFVSRIDKDGNIAKADEAWAKLYSFADASSKAVKEGGVFSPAQLAEAAKNQAPTTLAKGGGRTALGTESQKYLSILDQPDKSNWVYRVALASKAGTGVATAWLIPEIAIPVLMASGITYAAAKQLMKNPSQVRLTMQKVLENNLPALGAAGEQLLNQIKASE